MAIMYTLIFVALLMVSLVLHEAGHYWACHWFGIPVDKFAIGFGPTLFKFDYKETQFAIKPLPLGGYCSFNDELFNKLPCWKRVVVFAMGCVNNMLVGGVYIFIAYQFFLGSGNVFANLISSVISMFAVFGMILSSVGSMFTGLFNSLIGGTLEGPITNMITVGDSVAAVGGMNALGQLFLMAGIMSVAFAVFNILPIPSIDGGQIVVALINKLLSFFKMELPKKAVKVVNAVFLLVILASSLLLFVFDII